MRAQTSREYCICIKAPYPRRFLGCVGRTPLIAHTHFGDGSKCHRGKGLKTVSIALTHTSVCCVIPSSLGKYRRSFKPHQKEFLAPLPGRIFNIYQVPKHKFHLLAIYIICHFPLVFLSPTLQKFDVLFAPLFRSPFSCRICF